MKMMFEPKFHKVHQQKVANEMRKQKLACITVRSKMPLFSSLKRLSKKGIHVAIHKMKIPILHYNVCINRSEGTLHNDVTVVAYISMIQYYFLVTKFRL